MIPTNNKGVALENLLSFLSTLSENSFISTTAQVIGFFGMICVVVAYLSIEKSWLDRDDPRYYWINLLGAVLLTISLLVHFNLGSFLIEVFWFAISVSGLKRIYTKK